MRLQVHGIREAVGGDGIGRCRRAVSSREVQHARSAHAWLYLPGGKKNTARLNGRWLEKLGKSPKKCRFIMLYSNFIAQKLSS